MTTSEENQVENVGFEIATTRNIQMGYGEFFVTLHPDGTFVLNGETVNADDKDRGKRLYKGLCELVGVDAPETEEAQEERIFDVWSEGDVWWGHARASTLREACEKISERVPKFKDYFDPESMTWWGAKIFDRRA